MWKFFLICYFLLVLPIFSVEVLEINGDKKSLNLEILKIINNISDNKVVSSEKTFGFDYKYNLKWSHPYDFNIYFGSFFQNNNHLLRIESSNNGEEKVLKSILYKSLYPNQKNIYSLNIKKPLKKKSHIISQSLNLISPFMSVAYNSYKSPLYTESDTSSGINKYLLLDFFIIGVASWYIQDKTPRKTFIDNMSLKKGPSYNFTKNQNGQIALSLLFVVRLFRMKGSIHDTSFHNRLANWSYTKRF